VRQPYCGRGLACARLEVEQGDTEGRHGYSIAVFTALQKYCTTAHAVT
jgi:hypothetical protein